MSGKRQCGSCTACCTAMGVPELKKPAGAKCHHLLSIVDGAAGCSIYDRRPKSCRDFECVWLQGSMSDEHQPNKTGVVFTTPGLNSRFEKATGLPALVAFEAWTGAFDEGPARTLLTTLSMTILIIKVRGSSRSMIGPPDQIAKAQEFVTRRT